MWQTSPPGTSLIAGTRPPQVRSHYTRALHGTVPSVGGLHDEYQGVASPLYQSDTRGILRTLALMACGSVEVRQHECGEHLERCSTHAAASFSVGRVCWIFHFLQPIQMVSSSHVG